MTHVPAPPRLDTDTKYHAPQFIETYTGRPFYSLQPRACDITIIDIAHALSNQCRYSGHTVWFYSTAQHCCLLYDYVKANGGTPLDCLQILLHDGAEAYLVDVARPVKQFMMQYREWDHTITHVIRRWIGIDHIPIPDWQDVLDHRIVGDERDQLFSDSGLDWEKAHDPLGITIEPWSSFRAEQEFLVRYAQCTYELMGHHTYLRSAWGVSTTSLFKPIEFRTRGGDVVQKGDEDPRVITDLLEVDLIGGTGRVAVRSPNGMMVRDTRSGKFPRAAWKWIHGKFELADQHGKLLGPPPIEQHEAAQ